MRLLYLIFLLSLPFTNFANLQTFSGEVASVQKYSYVNQPVPYLQFILIADQKAYTVEVGPAWYLDMQGIVIVPQEKIEVEGAVFDLDGKTIIQPRWIKKQNMKIDLRAEDGTPLWKNP